MVEYFPDYGNSLLGTTAISKREGTIAIEIP